jgi:hypothetical protein
MSVSGAWKDLFRVAGSEGLRCARTFDHPYAKQRFNSYRVRAIEPSSLPQSPSLNDRINLVG